MTVDSMWPAGLLQSGDEAQQVSCMFSCGGCCPQWDSFLLALRLVRLIVSGMARRAPLQG
jgi:hypothetical protein